MEEKKRKPRGKTLSQRQLDALGDLADEIVEASGLWCGDTRKLAIKIVKALDYITDGCQKDRGREEVPKPLPPEETFPEPEKEPEPLEPEIEIGDIVEVAHSFREDTMDFRPGMQGVVVHRSKDTQRWGIDWFEKIVDREGREKGHHVDGHAHDGHGWWTRGNYLKVVWRAK